MKTTLLRFLVTVMAMGIALPSCGQSMLGHDLEMEAEPIREGEQPVIPLDTGDPTYNLWRTLRDRGDDPEREPGIINLNKFP